MTSPFIVYIGIDYSANDTFSAIQLTAATFYTDSTNITYPPYSYLTFIPITTVNTTSNLLITLTTTNKIPSQNGIIIIKFPYNLQWI